MENIVNRLLTFIPINTQIEPILSYTVITLFIVIIALLSNIIAKNIIIAIISKLIKQTKMTWDDIFLENNVFGRLSHIAPALVIYLSAGLMFEAFPRLNLVIVHLSLAYMVFIGCLVLDSILTSASDILKDQKWSKNVPIRSYIQVLKLGLYLLTAILILSILLQKSPWVFLSGLGAMTAIILLVFRDSILGLVAGIQLSANDLIREGDWIEMPKYGADGDVIDVSLNTIKVQNWDKTISSIPVYSLVSNSFKNWRGMSESGGRRIKRSLSIDMNTVAFCSEEHLNNWKNNDRLTPLFENTPLDDELTNLGLFRLYLKHYLHNHPQIHNDMTCLVRYLQVSEKGLPLEIYVFSSNQDWAEFEDIQATIIDHILAILPEFNLRIFQSPSGKDFHGLTATS